MDLHSIEDFMEDQSQFKDNVLQQVSKNLTTDHINSFADYNSCRRKEKNKLDSYRKGPAPIEESDQLRKSIAKATYGTLDSDLEDLDFEDVRIQNANIPNLYHRVRKSKDEAGHNLASCRALIVYFSKLAKTKDDDEVIDLNFFYSLLESGADINFPDKHGQTVLHEISRGWHPDVAKFAIENGANVNKADSFGRTPLHLAAAVDYDDMVQFLVDNGADLGAATKGENQTPMHYAAKNNATASLKVMLNMGGRINDRDYKRRTPLFVAAESARAEAARFLIEKGAPAGVYDSAGTPCLSLMIEKMPQIAIEAVEQFHAIDLAFRKHYYYLSFLERDPKFLIDFIPKKKSERRELKERKKAEKKFMKEKGEKVKKKAKTYAKTPLEVIVQYDQLDLIMHPVFQRLLHVKWNLFGKLGSAKLLTLNFIYTMIWTILGIMIPRGNDSFYTPIGTNWWRLVLEIFGVGMTGYFIFAEISELRSTEKKYNCWRQWQTQHMEKDLQYCHPRWPEEEQYLRSELVQIKSYQRTYFRDPWNIFEWIAYIVVLILVFTRVAAVASPSAKAREVHLKCYAIGLIVIWLRFMRPCRVFRTLGPFIAILGSVIADTMKFAFLFFEFFVPYTVAFWIIFGGSINGQGMGEYGVNWEKFNDLTFSVFCMTIMGPFDMEGLVMTDRLMTQVLCGTYFTLAGVVCMNLYIALLSDTFARVYAQANANAVMQQAKCIITLEAKLDKFRRSKFGHYMQDECSPQEVYSRDENNEDGDDQDYMFDKISRQILNRLNELEENMLIKLCGRDKGGDYDDERGGNSKRMSLPPQQWGDNNDVLRFVREQSFQNKQLSNDVSNLLNSFKRIESVLLNQNVDLSKTSANSSAMINNSMRRSSNLHSANPLTDRNPNNPGNPSLYRQSSQPADASSKRFQSINSIADSNFNINPSNTKANFQRDSQTLPRNSSMNNFNASQKSQTLPRKMGKTGKGLDEALSIAMGPLLSPQTLKRVAETNNDEKIKAITSHYNKANDRSSINEPSLSRSMDRRSFKNEPYPNPQSDEGVSALNDVKEQLERLQNLQQINFQNQRSMSNQQGNFYNPTNNNQEVISGQMNNQSINQFQLQNNQPAQQFIQSESQFVNQPMIARERQQQQQQQQQYRPQQSDLAKENSMRRRKEELNQMHPNIDQDIYDNANVFQRTLDSSDFQYQPLLQERRSKQSENRYNESGRSSRSSAVRSSSLYDSNDDGSSTSSSRRRRRRRKKNKNKQNIVSNNQQQSFQMNQLTPQMNQLPPQTNQLPLNTNQNIIDSSQIPNNNFNQSYPPQQQQMSFQSQSQQMYPPNDAPSHHPYPPETYQKQAYPSPMPYQVEKDVQYMPRVEQPNGYMLADQYPQL